MQLATKSSWTTQTVVKENASDYNSPKVSPKKPATYTKHDLLFKQLIHHFFEEFLEAFFPEVHRHIDFATLTPISEEVHTDLIEGTTRRLDIVVETKLKGEETVLIIHIEPQSSGQPNFNERMYHYFSLLYNKFRKPILPIAVFSYDENRIEQDNFTVGFSFFHVLTFNYLMLELHKKNWREYIRSDNPVAAALLGKMGYSEKEKVQVKKEFLAMLVRMKLNPAESKFINDFFEVYLKLNKEEEEQLMEQINQLENAEEIFQLSNSWEEKGRQEGREEGREESIGQVVRRMLKEELPVELIAKVTGLETRKIEEIKSTL